MTFGYSKQVKARKAHRCDVCGTTIPRGMVYLKSTGVYDGAWWETLAHEDCAEMHIHHNDGRSEDDQCDDYYLDEYRGHWPHAVCRIELRQQLREGNTND